MPNRQPNRNQSISNAALAPKGSGMRAADHPEPAYYFSRMLFFNIMLILLLGVLPQIGIFQYMIKAYNNELYRFNTQSVKQIQNMVDEQLLMPTVQIAKRNLTEMPDVNTALFYPMTNDIRNDYSAIVNVQETLSALQSEQPFIRYVDMYYFNGPVFFYGTRFFYFPEESRRDAGFRSPWLNDFLTKDAQVGWYTASAPDANGTNEKLISYVRSYPYFAPVDRRKAVFAIHLKESAIQQALTDTFDPSSGLALIMDERGNLISANGDTEGSEAYARAAQLWAGRSGGSQSGADDEQGSFETTMDGREAVVAYAHSRVNGWDYVTLVDKSLFYKKAADLKNLMYALWAGLLVIGILLLYILTKRQYRPIDTTLKQYSLQLHDLNEQLAINKPVIKYHAMMELLTGGESREGVDVESDMSRFLDLELRGERVCCFILQPRRESGGPVPPQLAEAYQLAERLEAQASGETRLWAIVAQDRSIYGLLNASLPIEEMEGLLERLIATVAGDGYTLCVGGVHELEQEQGAVADSHREAFEAGKYAFFHPELSRLDYGELNVAERVSTGGSVRFFAELEQALRAGEENRARQAITGAVDETLAGAYTADYGQHQLVELVYTFHKTLKGLGVDTQQLFGADIRGEASRQPNIEAFRRWLDDLAFRAFRHLDERRQRTNRDLVEGVRQFIADNLYGEISLDRAAGHLGVTSNYVSRQFKLNTGMTFIEYVTARKLEAAAELLQEGGLTVSAIAERLGYQSTNHFIRIFKEKYGVTPKQYQKNGPVDGS
ncbi:helix-turn-helix domain-containing protein [Paenibacillus sp. GCM10028914]|uniref:helix-turn-helix domain-containing protein n=1 Tax=Paenibacillus sp. GCM10028914 TaxID=3273416 RepID=UPI0036141AA2